MLCNADLTVYNSKTYQRHLITDVYWNDSRGQTVTKNGIQTNDSVLVYVYNSDYIPKKSDIIVKGNVDFEFNASSQQFISESMKKFRDLHPDFAVIKTVNDCRYGGLPHIELTAR